MAGQRWWISGLGGVATEGNRSGSQTARGPKPEPGSLPGRGLALPRVPFRPGRGPVHEKTGHVDRRRRIRRVGGAQGGPGPVWPSSASPARPPEQAWRKLRTGRLADRRSRPAASGAANRLIPRLLSIGGGFGTRSSEAGGRSSVSGSEFGARGVLRPPHRAPQRRQPRPRVQPRAGTGLLLPRTCYEREARMSSSSLGSMAPARTSSTLPSLSTKTEVG